MLVMNVVREKSARARTASVFTVLALACGLAFASQAGATFKGRPGELAFHSFGSFDPETICGSYYSIYVSRPDLTSVREVTQGADPSFSPDGRRIAYTRTCEAESAGPQEIWQIDADGSDPKPLISADTEVSAPSFSPDGRRIVFIKRNPAPEKGTDVWTARIDGTEQRRLTFDPRSERNPVWSPSGRYIVFGRRPAIWTVRADGSHEKRLTRGRDVDVSPDGRSIVFARSLLNLHTGVRRAQICLVRPGLGSIRVIKSVKTDENSLGFPVFSPNGRRILYVNYKFDIEEAELFSIRLDGGGDHRVRKNGRVGVQDLAWQAR